MKEMKVPFFDIVALHQGLEEELLEIFRTALQSGRFIGGPMVEKFESEFAAYCGAAHCMGVSSGTDALRLALIASGVKPGERVITVPNTFIATVEAISQAGAIAEFVDVDERTGTMDTEKLAEYLQTLCFRDKRNGRTVDKRSKRTVSAVIPVHLYGQTADMDPVTELARHYNLLVIEDACQAHGAEYFSRRENRWKKAGTMGVAGAFSFYPGKNLGACGEGGAVTTDSGEIADRVRMLRDHGQSRKYFHEVEGYNGRLDALQAGVLSAKLRCLSSWNEQRRICALHYDALLGSVEGVITPFVPAWARSVYHLYVIRSPWRAEIQRYLNEKHIETGLHYPLPLHLQTACRYLKYREGDFPVAERMASAILSLPFYPGLAKAEQRYVADTVTEAVRVAMKRDEKISGNSGRAA